jgi:hypothetical protein
MLDWLFTLVLVPRWLLLIVAVDLLTLLAGLLALAIAHC